MACTIRISSPALTPTWPLLGAFGSQQRTHICTEAQVRGLPGLAPPCWRWASAPLPPMCPLSGPTGPLSSRPTRSPVVLPITWEVTSLRGAPRLSALLLNCRFWSNLVSHLHRKLRGQRYFVILKTSIFLKKVLSIIYMDFNESATPSSGILYHHEELSRQ